MNILSIAAKRQKHTSQTIRLMPYYQERQQLSVVILKNDSVLPLVKCEVALFGNGQKYTVYTEGQVFVHTPLQRKHTGRTK